MSKKSAALTLRDVQLTDKYELNDGVAFMSGLQALARIPIVQRRRDIAAGLNTAGYISGYRGSPLGAYDLELNRAKKYLTELDIKFQPGVNEDLAATAIWGTQQINLMPGGSDYDGVFGIWYGKSPGVDRSGDVMKHANAYGTAPRGGVLAIVGDDHACKSSTLPCQSDHALYAMMIPQLYPASVAEFVEYGILGIEMSRYSGCWVALKVTSENVETSGTVDLSKENILPGVESVLEKAKAKGIKVMIGSSSKNARFILDKLGLLSIFDHIVDGNDVQFPKPHPEVFLNGAKLAQLEPSDCIVFEDAASGIKAAKEGGFKAIAVGNPHIKDLADEYYETLNEFTL
jgi:indolepyruvate ferredoxin oxidoreductase